MQYTLNLTENCNLNCNYCGLQQSRKYMSRETAFKVIDLVMRRNSRTIGIGFYGGEPLLCKDRIYEVVEYTKKKKPEEKNVFFKLTTNGLLLDDEFFDFAKREGLLISLSLDGNKEMHNANRCNHFGKGSYEKVLDIVPKILSENRYASILMTVAPNTVHNYYNGVKNIFDLGFMNIIPSIDYSGDWREEEIQELERQYKKISKLYYEKTISEDKFFFSPFDSKIDSHIRNKEYCKERCKLGYEQIVVDTNGNFYPCVQFIGDKKFIIGHIDSGIDEVKRKQIYIGSQKEHNECKSCAMKNRCLHSCACVNKYSTGNINEPSPVLCANERMLIPITDNIAEKLYKQRNGMFIQRHYNKDYPLISLIEDRERER